MLECGTRDRRLGPYQDSEMDFRKGKATLVKPIQTARRKQDGGIQSVMRALDILETIASESDIRLTDISDRLELNVSTCHHIVQTLLQRGYIEQDTDTRGYYLGGKVLSLKNVRLEQSDLYRQAIPLLRELNRDTGETVHLAALSRTEVLSLAKFHSTFSLRVDQGGHKDLHPLHCSSVGKAILSQLPETDVVALIQQVGMHPYTAKTITDLPALIEDLEKSRKRGYALDLEEFESGVCCIGAPCLNSRGEVVGSFSISMPTVRADWERMQEITTKVVNLARQISSSLGYEG